MSILSGASQGINDFIQRTRRLGAPPTTIPGGSGPTVPSTGAPTAPTAPGTPASGTGAAGGFSVLQELAKSPTPSQGAPVSNPVVQARTNTPPVGGVSGGFSVLEDMARSVGTTTMSENERLAAAAAGAARNAAASSAAAGRVGQQQEQANAGAVAEASQPAAARASVPAVPPSTPAVPPPAEPSKADALYDSVLDHLASGIQGGRPLPGTAAAIQQNRDILAQYAKGAEARAAALAAKTGAIGQGTANQMAQGTRMDILSHLANTELENTKLVANEQQQLVDRAIQAGQFGQTLDNNRSQFQQTLEQRKVEFDKNFGAEEAASYRNQLERMAVDNPVLASKLTDYLLSGKTGALGEFTAQEKADIQKYVAEKKGQQDKLTEVMNKVLEGIPGQIESGKKADVYLTKKLEEDNEIADLEKKLNTLQQGQYLSEDEFKKLEGAGKIQKFTLGTLPKGGNTADFLKLNPTGVVSVDGKQYKVVSGGRSKTSPGGTFVDPRHTDWVEVIDVATGQTKYIVNPLKGPDQGSYSRDKAGVYDAPPKNV